VCVCVCVCMCVCVYVEGRRITSHAKPAPAYMRVCMCVVCVGERVQKGGRGGGRTSNEDDKGLSGNGRGFRGTAVVGLTVAQGLGFKMPPSAQLPPPPAAASMSASRAIQGIAATR